MSHHALTNIVLVFGELVERDTSVSSPTFLVGSVVYNLLEPLAIACVYTIPKREFLLPLFRRYNVEAPFKACRRMDEIQIFFSIRFAVHSR